jgi:hypothetical protein
MFAVAKVRVEILFSLNCRSLPPHLTKAIFQQELPKMMAESS